MKTDTGKEKEKKPYKKPRLTTIELAVEEVLGVGCKLELGGTAFGASPCPINYCMQAGS